MFSKTLLLTVLCSAVLLANAAPEPQKSLRVRRAINDKVKTYLVKLNEGAKKLVNKLSRAWHTFWDRVTGRESARKQEEINALKAELSRLQADSDRELSAVKAQWQAKLAAQEEKLEILREQQKDHAAATERLRKLQEDAAKEINSVLNQWDKKADNLGRKIEKSLDEE